MKALTKENIGEIFTIDSNNTKGLFEIEFYNDAKGAVENIKISTASKTYKKLEEFVWTSLKTLISQFLKKWNGIIHMTKKSSHMI